MIDKPYTHVPVRQGFSLSAFVELDLPRVAANNKQTGAQDGQAYALQDHPMVILYGAVTALVVSVHMLALLISTCILPLVESAQKELQALGDTTASQSASRRLHLLRSHGFFEKYIQLAWILSTGIGIVLFAVDLPLIAFVRVRRLLCCSRSRPQFYTSSPIAGWVAMALLGPVVFAILVFAFRFYRELVSTKTRLFKQDMDGLNALLSQAGTEHDFAHRMPRVDDEDGPRDLAASLDLPMLPVTLLPRRPISAIPVHREAPPQPDVVIRVNDEPVDGSDGHSQASEESWRSASELPDV